MQSSGLPIACSCLCVLVSSVPLSIPLGCPCGAGILQGYAYGRQFCVTHPTHPGFHSSCIGINLHSLYSFTPLLLKPPQGGARVSALWDHARAREISGDLERSRESGIPTRHAQPPGHTQQAAANRVLGAIGAFTPCTVHAVYQGESCHRHMNGYQP